MFHGFYFLKIQYSDYLMMIEMNSEIPRLYEEYHMQKLTHFMVLRFPFEKLKENFIIIIHLR